MSTKRRVQSKLKLLLSQEGLKALHLLRNRVNPDTFSGSVTSSKLRSVSQGLQFSELTEYQSGNDSRLIDWKASARSRKTLVKKFEPELHRNRCIILDISDSIIASLTYTINVNKLSTEKTSFLNWLLGKNDKTKQGKAKIETPTTENNFRINLFEFATLLALQTLNSEDTLHLYTFNGTDIQYISSKSKNGWSRIANELTKISQVKIINNNKSYNISRNLKDCLSNATQSIPKGCQVFLCSDFNFELNNTIAQLTSRFDTKIIYQGIPLHKTGNNIFVKTKYKSKINLRDSSSGKVSNFYLDPSSINNQITDYEEEKIKNIISRAKIQNSSLLNLGERKWRVDLGKFL